MSDPQPPNTILLVDDEEVFRARLERAFARRGFTVFGASNYDEALRQVQDHRPALAVIDLKMAGKSGLEVLTDALAMAPGLRAVVLTGFGSIATATEAIRRGAVNYIPKPADVDDILRAFDLPTQTLATAENADIAPPHPGPRRVGAHPAGAGRLRRQYLCRGRSPGPAPPHPAAQALQKPAQQIKRPAHLAGEAGPAKTTTALEHGLQPDGARPIVLHLQTVHFLIERNAALNADTELAHGDAGADKAIHPLTSIIVRVGIRHGRAHVVTIEGLLDLRIAATDPAGIGV
jgi:two-component system, response regulator RegA